MSIYLDASVVVSLFVADAHSARAMGLQTVGETLAISDLTSAEFASALSLQHRRGKLAGEQARRLLSAFDNWRELETERMEVLPSDVRGAEAIIRRLDNPLRTADAMHLVIARRLGATLATFDQAMARAAPDLGVPLATL